MMSDNATIIDKIIPVLILLRKNTKVVTKHISNISASVSIITSDQCLGFLLAHIIKYREQPEAARMIGKAIVR